MLSISIQPTPNPNALKFILSEDVISEGKVSYRNQEEAKDLALAKVLFDLSGISQIHLFKNVVTVTKEGDTPWEDLEEAVKTSLTESMKTHYPNFNQEEISQPGDEEKNDQIQEIERILEETIRPALQRDGGDLKVIHYEADQKVLTVEYQGACGSCPHAAMGTLFAIKDILRDQFDPEIEVIPVG